jgi:hypothetical protein
MPRALLIGAVYITSPRSHGSKPSRPVSKSYHFTSFQGAGGIGRSRAALQSLGKADKAPYLQGWTSIRDAGVAGSSLVVPTSRIHKGLLQQGLCIYASSQGSCSKPDSSLRHLSAFRKSDPCGARGLVTRDKEECLLLTNLELSFHIIRFANEPIVDFHP